MSKPNIRIISDGTTQGTKVIHIDSGVELQKNIAHISIDMRPEDHPRAFVEMVRPIVDIVAEAIESPIATSGAAGGAGTNGANKVAQVFSESGWAEHAIVPKIGDPHPAENPKTVEVDDVTKLVGRRWPGGKR